MLIEPMCEQSMSGEFTASEWARCSWQCMQTHPNTCSTDMNTKSSRYYRWVRFFIASSPHPNWFSKPLLHNTHVKIEFVCENCQWLHILWLSSDQQDIVRGEDSHYCIMQLFCAGTVWNRVRVIKYRPISSALLYCTTLARQCKTTYMLRAVCTECNMNFLPVAMKCIIHLKMERALKRVKWLVMRWDLLHRDTWREIHSRSL